MDNFEDRKKAYLKTIDIDGDIIKSMLEKKDPNNIAMIAILLNPRNENELRVAKSFNTFFGDMTELVKATIMGNIVKVPVEENEGLKILTSIIKTVKRDGDISEEFIKSLFIGDNQNNATDYNKVAKFLIDALQIMNPTGEEIEYLVRESGIDLENELEVYALQASLERAQQTANSLNPTNNLSLDNIKEEDIKGLESFTSALHEQVNLRVNKNSFGFGPSKYLS